MPDLQTQVDILRQEMASMQGILTRNNFVGSQDFNKDSRFNTRLKVPHYNSLPTVAEVGEVVEVGGKLYICSSPNQFSLVGGQS